MIIGSGGKAAAELIIGNDGTVAQFTQRIEELHRVMRGARPAMQKQQRCVLAVWIHDPHVGLVFPKGDPHLFRFHALILAPNDKTRDFR